MRAVYRIRARNAGIDVCLGMDMDMDMDIGTSGHRSYLYPFPV